MLHMHASEFCCRYEFFKILHLCTFDVKTSKTGIFLLSAYIFHMLLAYKDLF